MKYWLAIFLLCSLSCEVFSQAHNSWDRRDTIYEKVKSVYVSDSSRVVSSCGSSFPWICREEVYRFDSNASVIEITNYSPYHSNKSIESSSYHVFANLANGKINPDSYRADRDVLRFDDRNHLVEKTTYNNDGTMAAHWEYKYDESGKLMEARLPVPMGELTGYEHDGAPGTLVVYTYNNNNKLTEKHYHDIYSNAPAARAIETFVYDNAGRLIKRMMAGRDEQNEIDSTSFLWEFDSIGNLIKEMELIINRGRSATTITTYQYDKANNLIREYSEDQEFGETFSTEYLWEYDKMNNWTKQIKYKDHVLSHIVKRKIKYYR